LSFASREVTHIKGYKRLNDTLGYDSVEFMSEFLNYREMKDKHEYMLEQVDLDTPSGLAEYLAKQILMEGVNLFGSFQMLLSFSKEGKLPGMVSVNQWSMPDESWHVAGLVELLRIYLEENPQVVNSRFKAAIYECARTVIKMEDDFIDLCFAVGGTTATTAEEAKAYIRYVCDYRMRQMGLKRQFDVRENPCEWVDLITSNTLGNFFETTITQYSKDSLTGPWVY